MMMRMNMRGLYWSSTNIIIKATIIVVVIVMMNMDWIFDSRTALTHEGRTAGCFRKGYAPFHRRHHVHHHHDPYYRHQPDRCIGVVAEDRECAVL